MPIFTGRIHCKCGHTFAFYISETAPLPPDARYVVHCPMNGSPYTVRAGDLPTADAIPPNAVPAVRSNPRRDAPTVATHSPALRKEMLVAAGLVLLALAVVVVCAAYRFR